MILSDIDFREWWWVAGICLVALAYFQLAVKPLMAHKKRVQERGGKYSANQHRIFLAVALGYLALLVFGLVLFVASLPLG